MSEPTVTRGTHLKISVEDPATPGTFIPVLLMTTRSFKRQKQTNDVTVPSRTNPDAVVPVKRIATTTSCEVTGSGKYALDDRPKLDTILGSSNSGNVRIEIAESLAAHGGYWQGAFHMTQLDVTGQNNDMADADVTFMSDGVVAWTDAAS